VRVPKPEPNRWPTPIGAGVQSTEPTARVNDKQPRQTTFQSDNEGIKLNKGEVAILEDKSDVEADEESGRYVSESLRAVSRTRQSVRGGSNCR